MFLVFDNIEEYALGLKESIVGCDILTPTDLERIFGLTGEVNWKIYSFVCFFKSEVEFLTEWTLKLFLDVEFFSEKSNLCNTR